MTPSYLVLLTYSNLSHGRGIDPCCRLCKQLTDSPGPLEDLAHLLTSCRGHHGLFPRVGISACHSGITRDKIMPDFLNTVAASYPANISHSMTTHILLHCSSLNLPSDIIRVPTNYPGFASITQHCSLVIIHYIHKSRSRQPRAMGLL